MDRRALHYRRAAALEDKILRGIGVEISPVTLLRADRIID